VASKLDAYEKNGKTNKKPRSAVSKAV